MPRAHDRWTPALLALALAGGLGACSKDQPAPTPPPAAGAEATGGAAMPDDSKARDDMTARLRALRDSADPASVGELIDLASGDQPAPARGEAADHLWMKVQTAATGGFAKDADRAVRDAVTAAGDRVIALLDDGETAVRIAAANIAGAVPLPDARAKLEKLAADDPDPLAKARAAKALAKLPPADAP